MNVQLHRGKHVNAKTIAGTEGQQKWVFSVPWNADNSYGYEGSSKTPALKNSLGLWNPMVLFSHFDLKERDDTFAQWVLSDEPRGTELHDAVYRDGRIV